MSFDLVAWRQPSFLYGEEARRLVDLEDESLFVAHKDVRAFGVELLQRLPDSWSMEPDDSDRLIWLTLSYSKVDEAVPVILALARKYWLNCLDLQSNTLYRPGAPVFQLRFGGHKGATNPTAQELRLRVEEALLARDHAILEEGPELYVQAGSAPNVGRKRTRFAVEYRLGSAERHFRHETDSLADVLSVFDEFLRGDVGHRKRLRWKRWE